MRQPNLCAPIWENTLLLMLALCHLFFHHSNVLVLKHFDLLADCVASTDEGKISQFLRKMSAEQVRKNIFHGFSDKLDDGEEFCIHFLQPDSRTHTLTKLDGMNFDGADVIDFGQGSLYVHLEVRNGTLML